MNKRKTQILVSAIVLVAMLASSLGVITALAFSDVGMSDWFFADVAWLDSNNITHGCDAAGHYCPYDYVTRAEMAAFLHREAGVLIAWGAHVNGYGTTSPTLSDWFCNMCGYMMIMPSVTRFEQGGYHINTHLDISNKYVMCAVDSNVAATRDAFCTVENVYANTVTVRIYDVGAGNQADADVWIMVYGN
jgi:hypothetical protein